MTTPTQAHKPYKPHKSYDELASEVSWLTKNKALMEAKMATTPTQAQIEAEQLLEELREPCGIQTQYTKAMYGHAAEVIEKLLAALTAAAQVGEQDISRDERLTIEHYKKIEEAIDATIERCAQVVDEKIKNLKAQNDGYGCTSAIIETLERIAAAIRKLKDE